MQSPGTYRLVAIAGTAFAVLFIATSAVQLKPFYWNPFEVSASLQDFHNNRYILGTGGWLRAFLVFPAVFLGAGMYQLLRETNQYAALAGSFLMVTYGLLGAVAGWVVTAMRLTAKEYQPGASDAHAIEVLADTTFWIQDNLILMSYIVLAAAVATFSTVMRSTEGFPSWVAKAGILTLPFILAGAILEDAFRTPEAFWYLAGAGPAAIALLVWIAGVVRSCIRPWRVGSP